MTFVEDSATQSWGERSICSPAYFFNGLLVRLFQPFCSQANSIANATTAIPVATANILAIQRLISHQVEQFGMEVPQRNTQPVE